MRIDNLSVCFGGVAVLRSVSVSCQPGTVVGIIGPNGSGKSTLINVATNLLGAKQHLEVQKHSTRTFQDSRLWKGLSVFDCVLIACQSRSVWKSLVQGEMSNSAAQAALERVNLWDKKDYRVTHLSYGERKLVELARALASNMPILFLDELFAGLSVPAKERVRAIITKEKSAGKKILIVEHDLSLIKEVCDFVYVLDEGECITAGTPASVFSNPTVQRAYSGIPYE